MGHVEALFTAPADAEPMAAADSVEAVEGGLRGDRYLLGTGHYTPYDVCQVTLVAGEALDHIRDEYDIDLTDGRHRRNVVPRGVDRRSLPRREAGPRPVGTTASSPVPRIRRRR